MRNIVAAVAAATVVVAAAGPARADMTLDQIVENMRRNNARLSPMQAQ